MTANIPTVGINKSLITSGEATELNMAILALITRITMAVFDLGALIRKMRDTKGYLELDFTSFEQWKGDIGIKRQSMYNYLKLDECWRLRLYRITELDKNILLGMPYSKILHIAHIILNKNKDGTWKHTDDTVVEWIHKAHVLSRSDLDIELKENHPIPRPLVLHFPAKWYTFIEMPQGKILTFSQVITPYDCSVQNCQEIFGGREVDITVQLKKKE